MRRRKSFTDVREAFWKQSPKITEVLQAVTAPRVIIVPLFMSEGYFSDQIIPRELGFTNASRLLQRGAQKLYYTKPIGSHDSITAIVLARAQEVIKQFPFPRPPELQTTTLFLAGHGTEQNQNSRKSIERQVELIRAMNRYAAVEAVFLDESPRINECYDLARTRNLILVPFFISDGMHTQQDIPVLLGEPQRVIHERLKKLQPLVRNPTERKGKLVWYAATVGTHPQIADVILDRAREATG